MPQTSESGTPFHRLFVAIDLPRELREELQGIFEATLPIWPETHAWRLARPEQLHFTLKFLGSTSAALLPELEQLLFEVSQHTEPFSVTLMPRISQFRGAQGMRVIWLGVQEQPAFGKLSSGLDLPLEKLGFTSERRPYQAHLTLARGRPRRRNAPPLDFSRLDEALAKRHSVLTRPWLARSLVLYESFTKPECAHYLELRRFPFPETRTEARTHERQIG